MLRSIAPRAPASLILVLCLALATTHSWAELGQGLVAYYPFDSPGASQPNRATALTGKSFLNDTAMLVQQAAITSSGARVGAGALLLDGSGDYADIAGNPVSINADWTISVWFRPDTANLGLDGTRRFQVLETSGGTFPISYGLRGDGGNAEQTNFEMSSQADSAVGLPSNYLISDTATDAWHHILITYDSDAKVMRGYLDGTSRHLFSVDGLLNYAGLHLGTYRTANDRWFKGRMDEVAIWQRALSAEEAAQVFALGSAGRPLFTDSDSDGLADHWEIDQFGTLLEDASSDKDEDGLLNGEEYAHDTSPTDADTDNDGLEDGAEVHVHATRPDRYDTDGDGLGDGDELARLPASNPTNPDTDGDGLLDGAEAAAQTNPTLQDTDNDGYTDYVEVAAGSAPLDSDAFPAAVPTTGLDRVVISEFVTNNWNGVNDEDLESPDWIELWNPTASPVDLTGWRLTDDPANLAKWTFPSRTLNPGGCLLVFASGKDRAPATGNLHTNFQLATEGGSLALVDRSGQIVSAFTNYPEQRLNVSYGFFGTSAPLAAGWLLLPTPGTVQSQIGLLGRVRDTTFSVRRGLFQAPFEVTVATPTVGATLAYTTDGSVPSATNGVQVPPASQNETPSLTIPIARTTTLRVVGHKQGWLQTNVDTQTYVFPTDVLQQSAPPAGSESLSWGRLGPDWAMDPDVVGSGDPAVRMVPSDLAAVPTVSLVLPFDDMWGINGIYPVGEGIPRDASFEVLNPDGNKMEPNAPRGFQARGQVHIFGGSTAVRWKMDKLSMRFRFSEELREQVFPDSPVRRFKTLVLDARSNHTWNHPIAEQRTRGDYVRDEVTADLQNALGGYAPHSRHVHLYINGLYWGLYTLHERPDHHFAPEYLGGTDSEYSAQKHNASDVLRGPISNGVATNADYLTLLGLANADLSRPENYAALAAKLDIDDFIRYMLVNYVAGNWDWASHNWYASFNRVRPEGRWRFHSWDAEHTWREVGEDFTGKNDPEGPTRIQHQLSANAEYRLRFADAVHQHLFNDGQLTSPAIQRVFETRLRGIDEAIRGESARWGDNYDISSPRTRRTWLRESARILGYVPPLPDNPETTIPAGVVLPGQRNAILGHFRTRGWYPLFGGTRWVTEAPEFAQHGGNVAGGFQLIMNRTPLQAPGTIYYTLDGSDPRVPITGAIKDTAQLYSAALTLTQSVLVKARVLNGSEWSPLTEAFFTVDTIPATGANLVVSEVMYHPSSPTAEEAAAGFGDAEDFEFLELLNISHWTIDLTGVAVGDAVTFAFSDLPPSDRFLAPGGRALLVKNAAAMRKRYGNSVPISGTFSGNLSNGGERILLQRGAEVMLQFTYDDVDPWPVPADGDGFSLLLNNPFSNPDQRDPWNWRAGAWFDGAPGSADSLPAPGDAVGDEDGDGVSNLLAYASRGQPKVLLDRAVVNVNASENEYVIISHTWDRAADGFTIIAESTRDLFRWNADCVLLFTRWNPDGTATSFWRSELPSSALGDNFYMRIRVSPMP